MTITTTTRISARLEANGQPVVIDGEAPILLLHSTTGATETVHLGQLINIAEVTTNGTAVIFQADVELPEDVYWPDAYQVAVAAVPVLVQRRPGYIATQGRTAEDRRRRAPNGGDDSDEGWSVRAFVITPGSVTVTV